MFNHIFFKSIVVGFINILVSSALKFILYNATNGYWGSSAVSYVLTIAFLYLMAYGISKPAMNYLLRNSQQKYSAFCRIVFREAKNEITIIKDDKHDKKP